MKIQDEFILVGFGKHDLDDMMEWVGTEREEDLLRAPEKWPPRYREMKSCSEDQLVVCKRYIDWLNNLINQFTEKYGEIA